MARAGRACWLRLPRLPASSLSRAGARHCYPHEVCSPNQRPLPSILVVCQHSAHVRCFPYSLHQSELSQRHQAGVVSACYSMPTTTQEPRRAPSPIHLRPSRPHPSLLQPTPDLPEPFFGSLCRRTTPSSVSRRSACAQVAQAPRSTTIGGARCRAVTRGAPARSLLQRYSYCGGMTFPHDVNRT